MGASIEIEFICVEHDAEFVVSSSPPTRWQCVGGVVNLPQCGEIWDYLQELTAKLPFIRGVNMMSIMKACFLCALVSTLA